jgi:NADPH:quinone reductase-like Zn-dependent oxidoreductase
MADMTTQRAVISDGPGVAKVVSGHGIAPLRPDYMLVKVKAVALNPTDWLARDVEANTKGSVLGVDYAGVVEKVADGDNTKKWSKGDRVAGSVHGGEYPNFSLQTTHLLTRLYRKFSFPC